MWVRRPIGQDQIDRNLLARVRRADLSGATRQAQVLGLADPGPEQDGIDLRDRRQQRALAATDEAARLDLRGTDEPVDRRGHVRVPEVERHALHFRLARLDLRSGRVGCGDGVVELLGTDGLLGGQWLQALDVVLRLFVAGLRGPQFGLRVCQRGFERLAVDAVEHLSLAHQRALVEADDIEEAFDTRADLDVLEAAGLSDQFHRHRHVTPDDRRDEDLGRGWWRRRRFLRAGAGQQAGPEQRDDETRTAPRGLDMCVGGDT